ncbi:hypothetical protein SAMN05661093_10548 [Kibdelosporangium aridum]|uniref:Uncharacterized protein n=1 Tax=Kibdelosporangium aridum TaxID=2030 RepID=A0A1W2FYI8_KIBAR|nr:hypothetical protein SAMN05661093_10548 [Kibdelosporangium aridum]
MPRLAYWQPRQWFGHSTSKWTVVRVSATSGWVLCRRAALAGRRRSGRPVIGCPIRANTKFNTVRNFTHHIRPGDRFVAVNDPSSVAAVKKHGIGATVVHVNNTTAARSVTVDLSRFGVVTSQASVTPVVTSASGALVRGAPVGVTGRSATLTVPAKSVTTFLVDGVSDVRQRGHWPTVGRCRTVHRGWREGFDMDSHLGAEPTVGRDLEGRY